MAPHHPNNPGRTHRRSTLSRTSVMTDAARSVNAALVIDLTPIAIDRGFMKLDPCAYCGGQGSTFDHIDPRSRGGSPGADNLTRACALCNKDKSSHTLIIWLACRLETNTRTHLTRSRTRTRKRREQRKRAMARRRGGPVMALCGCHTFYEASADSMCPQCRAWRG
jgi:5-methylcytosine-specific restriction endonuclease McrA